MWAVLFKSQCIKFIIYKVSINFNFNLSMDK